MSASIFRRKEATTFADIAFDLLNFGRNAIVFRDFHPDRRFGQREGFPIEITIPPGCMAVIPDEFYQGRTDDGLPNNECVKLFGKNRPLRQAVKGANLYDPAVYQMPEAWTANHALRPR